MKKILILIALIQASTIVCAQDSPTVGALYKFISPMTLAKCDENGKAVADTSHHSVAIGWQFIVQKVVPKGIIISFAQWRVSDVSAKGGETARDKSNKSLNDKYFGSTDVPIYFLISAADLKSAVRLQHAGTVSLVTGASFIKFRPGSGKPISKDGKDYYKNTDISNDFTLSLLASVKLSKAGANTDFFGLFGVNFSSIKVTPATSQGFLASETNVGSIAPTIGFEYQIDRVQFGLLSGIDVLTGDVNRYFVYRGRPWISLGIGFSILKGYGTSADNKN
ncbi:hypothetical protein [Mucilaginibacter sp. NFX135]|uniref:hypothetical protein n=1 Tax=Mucilaginibacter sp. NFX135 TaxID=3402687 RepID=UPI003AFB657B